MRERERYIIINVYWSSCKVPIQLVTNWPQGISKNTQIPNFMKIRKIKAQVFIWADGHMDGLTEGEKDRYDEANSGFPQF